MKYIMTCLIAFFASTAALADSTLDNDILRVRNAWDHANYELTGSHKEQALEQVAQSAARLVEKWPGRAEPLVWQGIALGSWAGAKGGLGALDLARQARKALLKAEKIDPDVLDGSVYTTLGSLYYRVPGWPIGFGDDDKAKEYFLSALRLNPNGLDSNYFYGDFLLEQGQYEQSVKVLRHALQAAPRPDRPIADQGRRKQVQTALHKALDQTG